MISLRSIYLTCALLGIFSLPAFCTPVFYADRTSWLNVVSGPTTLTFENAVGNYSTSTGFTTGLVLPDNPTFVGMIQSSGGTWGYNLQIVDHNASQWDNFGSGDSLWWSATSSLVPVSYVHVTFPTPVTAIAVDLMTSGGTSTGFNARLNGNSSLVYTSSPTTGWPNHTFFGFTSTDVPVSSIDFYLPANSTVTPLLDNFSFGTAGADPPQTPELSTFLLIATGLIGTAVMGRRARRRTAE